MEGTLLWSPRSHCIAIVCADLEHSWFGKEGKEWRGAGSSGGTEAMSSRMISIEGVVVTGVWGYRFARRNLKKQKMKWELYSYSNADKSPYAGTVFNYQGYVYLYLWQRKLDRASRCFCKTEHHKYSVCHSHSQRYVFALLGSVDV